MRSQKTNSRKFSLSILFTCPLVVFFSFVFIFLFFLPLYFTSYFTVFGIPSWVSLEFTNSRKNVRFLLKSNSQNETKKFLCPKHPFKKRQTIFWDFLKFLSVEFKFYELYIYFAHKYAHEELRIALQFICACESR